jgi:hypothetical protein
MTEPNADAGSRLHNCGPGAREIFRCAPIGTTVDLDLARALMGWDAMPWRRSRAVVSGRYTPDESDSNRIDSAFVQSAFVEVCGRVLETLDAPRPGGARMAAMVRSIVAVVLEHGWHRALLGLARHAYRNPQLWCASSSYARSYKPRCDSRDVALTIAAHAVYTPPLLLWTRAPSLDWLRPSVALHVRCPWKDGAR